MILLILLLLAGRTHGGARLWTRRVHPPTLSKMRLSAPTRNLRTVHTHTRARRGPQTILAMLITPARGGAGSRTAFAFCPLAVQASSSRGGKSGGSKGAGKKCNASNLSSSSAAGGAGGNASALAAARAESDEAERRRTDPLTDLHLWTFSRKNPLADGARSVDDPTWPGPLKEVSVDERMGRRS